MPIPIWAGHYIGLPFKGHGRDRSGLDCWGLVRMVLAEQFDHAVPSFIQEYDRTTNVEDISRLIRREAALWHTIDLAAAVLGDVIVLRMRGAPMHVGVVLGDGNMLHIEQGTNSAIEKYTSARWQKRIEGFYRYKSYFDE